MSRLLVEMTNDLMLRISLTDWPNGIGVPGGRLFRYLTSSLLTMYLSSKIGSLVGISPGFAIIGHVI